MRAAALLLAALLVLTVAPLARAAEARLDLGFHVGWMIWGDAAVRGARANQTGGFVLVPSGRVSLRLPELGWLDAQYALSPMVLAPFSEQTGLVLANDLGVELHAPDGSIGVSLAATGAPLYATFCNPEWCFPEALIAWGGAARVFAQLHRESKGRAVIVEAAVRVLYAEPTAWTWPGLAPELRRVIPTSTMLTAGGSWSW